jgi:hypothetical protein
MGTIVLERPLRVGFAPTLIRDRKRALPFSASSSAS